MSEERDERSRKIAPSLPVESASIARFSCDSIIATRMTCVEALSTGSEGAIFRLRSSLSSLKMTIHPSAIRHLSSVIRYPKSEIRNLTMKLRSMRARMTALFALFVALLMLLAGGAVQRHEMWRSEKRVKEILEVARERADAEIAKNSAQGRDSLLETVRADAGEIAAGGLTLMVTQGDKVLWQSRRRAPNWPDIDDDWRARTLAHNGQTLVLARDWEPVEEDLEETAIALWALGFLVVGATAVAAWFVVGITLSPLDKLAAQARVASTEGTGLDVRLRSPSSDAEMTYLTQTLNALLAQLQREAQARGRFYAAASHELRTPIQVLQGQIDVAQSRPRSVAAHEEVLAQLQAETQRLAALVADLLQLNSLEMRQSETPRETLNLAFWVERALSQQAQALAARASKLQTRLEEVEICAPPLHLEMLLRNLLENAAKYNAPGGTIEIVVKRTENGAQLRLWNACELPDDAQIENWFEPFYRPDAARNSQTGGNGLGLSIVAALGRANGWHIALQQRDGGVEATVNFGGSQ